MQQKIGPTAPAESPMASAFGGRYHKHPPGKSNSHDSRRTLFIRPLQGAGLLGGLQLLNVSESEPDPHLAADDGNGVILLQRF